eukprot:38695-Eustigmatos_ZCMA.PRE.1
MPVFDSLGHVFDRTHQISLKRTRAQGTAYIDRTASLKWSPCRVMKTVKEIRALGERLRQFEVRASYSLSLFRVAAIMHICLR